MQKKPPGKAAFWYDKSESGGGVLLVRELRAVGGPAGEHFKAVAEGRQDRLEVFHRTLWTAGEVHDETVGADAGLCAGEHRARRDLHRGVAHGLRDAGAELFANGDRRLRRHVARGEARPAGRDDEFGGARVRERLDRGFDLFLFIGDDEGFDDLLPRASERLGDARPALVDALAARAAVAHGDNGCFKHGNSTFRLLDYRF